MNELWFEFNDGHGVFRAPASVSRLLVVLNRKEQLRDTVPQSSETPPNILQSYKFRLIGHTHTQTVRKAHNQSIQMCGGNKTELDALVMFYKSS